MAQQVARVVYAQCYKWSQLLENHCLENGEGEQEGMGRESLTTATLANLLFPDNLIL